MEYKYPINDSYSQTTAILDDGRQMTVDTHRSLVIPMGTHADGCSVGDEPRGHCDCGALDGVDVEAMLADAKEHGKFGREPLGAARYTPEPPTKEWKSKRGLTLTQEMDRDDSDF